MKLKLFNTVLILPFMAWICCLNACSVEYSMQESLYTMRSKSHIEEILSCVRNDHFIIYSQNLGGDEINMIIDRGKHKKLRTLIHKALSTNESILIEEKDQMLNKDHALRVKLYPYSYDGKNIELRFPQLKSEKVYRIYINLEILSQLKHVILLS